MSFVVFDLDGTLIDGYVAIAEALAFAMEKMGFAPLPVEKVRGMVGHGVARLLEKAVGAEKAPEGVRLYRERYREVALEQTELMPDVPEVLAALETRGYPMAVASNKPAEFSRKILDAMDLGRFFTDVAGPDPEIPVKPSPAMLQRLMAKAGASPKDTIVVGDTEVDSEFGRAAGCHVVLVPGGSRSREELARIDADALLDRLAQLPDWLQSAKF